jgi:hypothetical protein
MTKGAAVLRAVVIIESLRDRKLPDQFHGIPIREYEHPLDDTTTVTIAEFTVAERHALDSGMVLARSLLPTRFYAHLHSDKALLIAFPDVLVWLGWDDAEGERRAQAIGGIFDIPLSQMRFLEMFETDHPDAPVRVG